MPQLQYPYFKFPGNYKPRPVASIAVINPYNGLGTELVGILDTGADSTTLTEDIAQILKIDLNSLPSHPVGGVHGINTAKYCDFLQIEIVDPLTQIHHSLSKHTPVPVYFSSGTIFHLIGQRNFLEHCISTFDGPLNQVSIQF